MSTDRSRQDAASENTRPADDRPCSRVRRSARPRSKPVAQRSSMERSSTTHAALMKSRGTYFDPNFLVINNYLENKPKFPRNRELHEEGFRFDGKALPVRGKVLQMALAKKVKVVLGTDAVAGAHGRNSEEFIIASRKAISRRMDAIVSGTSLAAESLGLGTQIGSIAAGYQADIVAVDGDVSKDITVVRKVVFVMKDGKVFRNQAVTAK